MSGPCPYQSSRGTLDGWQPWPVPLLLRGAVAAWPSARKQNRFPMAFPCGVTPFEAFPFAAAVPRQPFLLTAHRSPSLLRRTEKGLACDAWSRSSGLGHRGRYPLAVACRFGAGRTIPRTGRDEPCDLAGSLDLRALVHCKVRCVHPEFPPGGRPMLPWACPFEGCLMPRGSRCLLAARRGPKLPCSRHRSVARSHALGASSCTGPKPV
jgi:hypothetical protein